MPKRLAAALASLLMLASVLAVVPLASPAAAHSQTKQRCSYDPFAGKQCWTETVAHTHTPPPTCRAGTTGTYPNCYPIPSGNEQNTGDEEAKQRAEEARRKAEEAEAERQRKAAEAERYAVQEAERKRKEAEARAEAERKRKEAERREADEAQRKADEQARQRRIQQERKEYREKEQKRLAEAERKRKEEAERERKAEEERQRKAEEERDRKVKEAQEEARKPKPCGGSTGQGGTPHHKHVGHGTAGHKCHPDTPGHTHPTPQAKCPGGYKYNADTDQCELTGAVKITQDVGRVVVQVEGQVLCMAGATTLATKVTNGILKGVSEAAKYIAKTAVELTVEDPCDQVWADLTEWVESNTYKPDTIDPNGSDSGDDENADGSDSGEDDTPAGRNAPDNTDYTYDGGEYARKMCAEHSVEYFCNLISANEQSGDQ
ncbi:MAG: hypothetical protein OXM54_01640 [Acidimicrobiaceae bacterium]|nr:hypothetical protein [Acidimicrobiaceae bacterium]